MTEKVPVIIIGAGPAGLASAAVLSKHGIETQILEGSSQLGGTYAKLHPSLQLLSPNPFNALPLTRLEYGKTRINAGQYHRYLLEYAKIHQLAIHYDHKVKSVGMDRQGYLIQTGDGTEFQAKIVIVATGMSSFPKPLTSPVLQNPKVVIREALQWQGSEELDNQTVLIVGSGTTALELATLSAGRAQVYLAANTGIKKVPLSVFKVNIHYWVRWIEKLPKFLFPNVCRGDWHEPAINIGIERAVQERLVNIVELDFINENRAYFTDGKSAGIDTLFNCTGYTWNTDFLPENVRTFANNKFVLNKNESVSHRNLFFIGFPCAGGIDSKFLRGIRSDAYRINRIIRKRLKNT